MNKRPQSSKIVLGCLAVLVATLALFVTVAVVVRWRDSRPEVTRQAWEAARRRWEQQGPANYDITVEVHGRRPATYQVEVRGGEARSAAVDGRPVTQQRLFDVWSVPGMFATLDRELALKANRGSQRPGAPQDMRMYCQWDAIYGYPRTYRRLAIGGDDIGWEVTEFLELPPSAGE